MKEKTQRIRKQKEKMNHLSGGLSAFCFPESDEKRICASGVMQGSATLLLTQTHTQSIVQCALIQVLNQTANSRQKIYTLIALSKIEIFVHKTAEQAVKLYKESNTFITHEFVSK